MKSSSITALGAVLLMAASAVSCDDTVSQIGSSLAGTTVEIIVDSAYTVEGRSVIVNDIKPKTSNLLIGRINVPEYGILSSDVVTQFLPSTVLDTADFSSANVDSIFLNLRYSKTAFTGDSVAPMGLSLYPLTTQLTSSISSAFDPAGKYNAQDMLGSSIYTAGNVHPTSAEITATTRTIDVKLPRELGRRLFKDFEDNPADYANGRVFAENVFPGMYIANSYGSGRLTVLSVCGMTMYLRKIYTPEGEEKPDTIDGTHLYYLTTPEVISNNNIRYTPAKDLSDRIAAGKAMLIAPCGAETEITFPLKEVLASYTSHNSAGAISVLNTLTMRLPVDSIANEAGITPPPYLLMVLKKDREEFFAKNKLTDNVTSFYATYNSSTKSYFFGNLRDYLTEMQSKDEITPEDYTFDLVPVQVNFEDLANSGYYYYGSPQQTESDIQPFFEKPVMGELKLSEAKIKLTYSLQTQK